MNRTLRAAIAVVFIGIIMFCAISISQNIGKPLRIDVTDQKLYTLSNGTKSILAKLHQPVKIRLYYTKTAAMKGPDRIRYFNNYYNFVHSLLAEYSTAAAGNIDLQIIDPRPFSNEEADALRFGLKRIPLSEEESFFFGLVVQTQFGVTKTISFLTPERQNFIEYDISYLIDTAISREKQRIGVLSSLPVMGDDVTGYMAQMMRMQGQQPKGPWTIIEHLREKYHVSKIETDVEDINNVDILLVIHPKDLPQKTLFAIDQFVLKGGRTVVCVDPHCYADQPPAQRQMMLQGGHKSSSDLNALMQNWGLQMPENTFVGDRSLALLTGLGRSGRPQKFIGALGLAPPECFNSDSVITARLNEVRVFFAGVLEETEIPDANNVRIERLSLLSTTSRGNSWSLSNRFELMMPDPVRIAQNFIDGSEPVHMGYLVTGRFKSSFPNGIEITDESDPNAEPRHVAGLTKSSGDCVVAVFSDVDFITDSLAYDNSFFGKVAVADNAALLLNTIDELGGSADLISIRSRGSFRRPFTVVDEITAQAEKETAEEENGINAEIASFRVELNKIISSAKKGEQDIIGRSILKKKSDIELRIHEARMRLRDVKLQKLKRITKLGSNLRNLNTLPGPAAILVLAVILTLWRNAKRRRYISHASDA